METRSFGSTDLQLSEMGLGGLLARYEGVEGHPPPEEKRRICLRAAELGINLFDMGYGDGIHIPDELKGSDGTGCDDTTGTECDGATAQGAMTRRHSRETIGTCL